MTRLYLPSVWLLIIAGLLLMAMPCAQAAEAKRPAVLFTTGEFHLSYFAKPLHADGIELHVCTSTELPTLLATGNYNVVVITGGLGDAKVAAALKAFMAEGGGVLVLPGIRWAEADYVATQHFLEAYGAHFTMSVISETDPGKIVPTMFTNLLATDTIAPPYNDGVPGLLYLEGHGQSGMSSPVSVVTDANWIPVVKASPTAKAVGYAEETKKDILPYVNAKPDMAPTLLAVRPMGKGFLAALGITSEWIWGAPANCPAIEDMLSRGRGGKASNWIHLYANLFRSMAAPTLKEGKGGALTLTSVLEPSKKVLGGWGDEMAKARDWTKAPPIEDQEQLPGLIGARSNYSGGKATVEEWVKAAKAAQLKYIVFLEPLEFTTEANFNQCKAECAKYSDDTFFACPGIWGKDVRKKASMFTYGENVQFPLAKILTPDGKYFDDSKGWDEKQMPTKYIFDYFFEQLGYKGQFGYFRHRENVIPPWEYKMNNTFVVYSTENGQPLDNALDDFSYLQATNFCYHPTAMSLMDDPAQIARAVKEDWRMVNVAPGEFGDGSYSAEYGTGVSAMRKLYKEQVAWLRPFQYITQGPTINCWRARWEITLPDWYHPDSWRYRARLHVSSEAGLKEIVLMSAGKVYARFLPNGAKSFDKSFEFENSQQRVMYPIITDMNGKRAIGSYIRNSNTRWNDYICGDRCNFLIYYISRTANGKWYSGRLDYTPVTQNKGCWHVPLNPSDALTVDYPTMPVDGAPVGKATPSFSIVPGIETPGYPGFQQIENKPKWVVAGPDVLIGGGALDNVAVDPKCWGNAWSWWSGIKPNPFIGGYGLNTAFVPYPEGLRAGWYEFHLTARQDLPLTNPTLPIYFTSANFSELHLADGTVYQAKDKTLPASGPFKNGAYVLVYAEGGPAALYSLDDEMRYAVKGGQVSLGKCPAEKTLAKDTPITMKLGYLGSAGGTELEVLRRYFAVLNAPPIKVTGGTFTGDGIAVHIDGHAGAVTLDSAPLPFNAYLCVEMTNLQPNWDAWIVDQSIPAPNWRQVVKNDGIAYAALPCATPKRYFLGHPVMADNPALKISLCNTLPDQWQLTLHNPTDQAITTQVWTAPQWTPFKLRKKRYTIPAGDSVEVAIGK